MQICAVGWIAVIINRGLKNTEKNTLIYLGENMKTLFNPYKVVVLTIVLIIGLTSCVPPRPLSSKEEYMQICGFYAVPIPTDPDIKNNSLKVSIKEIDDYNRILFDLSTIDYRTQRIDAYYVICQKYDTNYSGDRYVYFYEDIGYMIKSDKTDDIEVFKENNDWNMPLDETKMSRRSIIISYDGVLMKDPFIHENDLFASLEQIGIAKETITKCNRLDTDGVNHEMFLIESQNDSILTTYYVIADTEHNVSIFEVDNDGITTEEYVEFKKNNGWIYGW